MTCGRILHDFFCWTQILVVVMAMALNLDIEPMGSMFTGRTDGHLAEETLQPSSDPKPC